MAEIVYRINSSDELIYINEAWDSFAASNSGDGAISDVVLNRPLWDFITDQTTQDI